MRSPLSTTRRRFLKTSAAAFGVTIVPRYVVAGSGETPPSEKVNIACIGVGGRGAVDIREVSPGNNLVALCDVDDVRAAATYQQFPQTKRYKDFRRMLDEMDKQIDAVTVATPDHTHAVAALAAIRRGKHVHCQKPLAHSIHEVRALMKAAREHKVVTQMGNQGHSSESIRLFCEWIWDGAIGKVHTIHAGCFKPHCRVDQLADLQQKHDVPATLDWDLWLGPARQRPYHPYYLPNTWRDWSAFGNGTIGDWVCHVVDPVFWALDLGAPTIIQSKVTGFDPKRHGETFPQSEQVTFEFPAKGQRPPVTLHWYSGLEAIPRPADLPAEQKDVTTGAYVLGDRGTIKYGSHGAGGVRIVPEAKMRDYRRPAPTLPRVPGNNHAQDWLNAIRSGGKAGSDFAYGGPLTEIALLGIIAGRFPEQKLRWDSANMQFVNCPEANAMLHPPCREGWDC